MRSLLMAVLLGFVACNGRKAGADDKAPPVNVATIDSLSRAALQLVREYVERDSRGERLKSNAWFNKVVAWPEDPGYDSYTVITGFLVEPIDRQGDTARVRVSYNVAGEMRAGGKNDARFSRHDTLQAVVFRIGKYPDGLSIMEPQIEQHVLVDSALTKSSLGADDRRKLEGLRGAPH